MRDAVREDAAHLADHLADALHGVGHGDARLDDEAGHRQRKLAQLAQLHGDLTDPDVGVEGTVDRRAGLAQGAPAHLHAADAGQKDPAFSQDTGEFVWATQIGYDPPRKGQAVSGAPIYVDGKVFTGLANGDWAFRGKVVALDANTGDVLWDFWTIPGPGEPGSENLQQTYADLMSSQP